LEAGYGRDVLGALPGLAARSFASALASSEQDLPDFDLGSPVIRLEAIVRL